MRMQRVDYPSLIQELIRQLRRMPGIGPRSAERIALWIVQRKEAGADQIADAIAKTVSGIRSCVRCGFFSEADQCAICTDPGRDARSLCVVEQPTDIIIHLEDGCRRWITLVPRIFESIRWCAG